MLLFVVVRRGGGVAAGVEHPGRRAPPVAPVGQDRGPIEDVRVLPGVRPDGASATP
jgi:hypothetical protein